jgi:GT2 family glycosyltransferase
MKHVVIIPAHNEARFIQGTLESLIAQTLKPDRIIVVDDGSTDATREIVQALAREEPCLSLIEGPPQRTRRYRVVEVFNLGYQTVRGEDFSYVSKIDADLVFPPDYFERLFEVLDAHPSIAAGAGMLYDRVGDDLQRWRIPENYVSGPIKTIRKSVFDQMGGFVPALGWDMVDQVQMRALGFSTVLLPDLAVVHLRKLGSATGLLRGHARHGQCAYTVGSHPAFALGRSIYRMLDPPYVILGLAFGYGYIRAWLAGAEQIPDRELIRALRREQVYRLFHLNRLPKPS